MERLYAAPRMARVDRRERIVVVSIMSTRDSVDAAMVISYRVPRRHVLWECVLSRLLV